MTAKPSHRIQQYRLKLVRERTVLYAVGKVVDGDAAALVLHAMLDDADREKLVALYLNGHNVPVGCEVLAVGGLHGVSAGMREVMKGALLANADAIILGHNHPSGDPEPSPEDIAFTKTAAAAGETLGIHVVDHIIVTRDGRHSSLWSLGLFGAGGK